MKLTNLVAGATLALGMGIAVSPAAAADVEVLHWWTSVASDEKWFNAVH